MEVNIRGLKEAT